MLTTAKKIAALAAYLLAALGIATPAAAHGSPHKAVTRSEEALLAEVESTWVGFLDKAANNDRAALDYLAPQLRSEYGAPSAFAALSKVKSMQKDFDVLEVDATRAQLATVLARNGQDSLHYVRLERSRGRWWIAGL